jgi:FlaA1/EpsC-like NDP-sugar epimerase
LAVEDLARTWGTVVAPAEQAIKRLLPVYAKTGDRVLAAANRFVYNRTNQLTLDALLTAVGLLVAYLIRFDGELPPEFRHQFLQIMPFAAVLGVACNSAVGVYTSIWRFFGLQDAALLALSATVMFVVSLGWRDLSPADLLSGGVIPLGVLLPFPWFAFAGMVGGRLARRLLYARTVGRQTPLSQKERRRLLLAGAGEAGLRLLHELRDTEHEVVGFVDDAPEVQGRTIGGWRVLGTTGQLETIVRNQRVDEVILCMPSAPTATLHRIVNRCEEISVKTSSVPTLAEIMSDRVRIGQLRPINMEALLGRDSVRHPHDVGSLMSSYAGRRILVTGAGGSIGSELVRQLSRFQPSELILLDKDENNLYEISCEVREDFTAIVDVIADIRNRAAIEKVFQRYRPEVVFHAAAYKHVPLMEQHPAEAILNNVTGTRHVAELSKAFGTEAFVLISTDKAVNPSNIMGASKRVAELIVQSLAAASTRTRFCCVRFGNVLGSRASVVPIFQRQIRQGRAITVTHPDVTRYFMTIPEAVQLVIQAGSLGAKGEIFLLDMGDPVKIVDLARNLIELSGHVPDKDIAIEFTGLRPGEKLDEELLIAGERSVRSTAHSKIFVVGALDADWSHVQAAISDLELAASDGNAEGLHRILHLLEIGYHNTQFSQRPREAVSMVPDRSEQEPRPARVPRSIVTG